MSEMKDPACSSARLGRTSRINQTVPSPKFIIIAENTDKNTDRISVQSGEREGDGVNKGGGGQVIEPSVVHPLRFESKGLL